MIIGIGCDLIDIQRIESAMQRPRFLDRLYTEPERARIAERGADTAAGLFAAKEAASKALGTGFRGFFACDIEVIWDELGKPRVNLHGGAKAQFEQIGGKSIHLSISHAAGFAQAFVVVEG